MSYYDVVIQPDGRPALVIRIEPPRHDEPEHQRWSDETPEIDRGVTIIGPEEDTRGVVIWQM